jgi:alkanesulfonate monooxygenase SsuD/methylene tetrahydromethanopterin reductase-like flavin-dependent oxidoreductase (luciferase family)
MSERLRFGMTLPVEHLPGDDIGQRFDNLLEAARLAEAAGFSYLDAPQHYLAAPSQYLHCVPVLARLASEVSSVKLCTNIIQLTLHHPVQIAEELATLDVITGGRLVVGFGRGYREDEFLAFGVGPGARLGRFLEAWEIVRRLWAEDSVTFDGKHFQLADASIGIRPVQPNGPPLVLAASGDKMIARAAKMADGWSAVGHSTLDILARQSDLYKQALADAGRAFPPQHYRVAVETYVAPTRAEAERKAFPHVARKYAGYASWGQDKELPDGQTFDLPIEELRAERFNIGDPVQVTERFLEYHAAMGMSELGVRLFWAGMPHADLLAAIELMGERVMPDVLKAIG